MQVKKRMKIGIVATEPSGDALGAELIEALRDQTGSPIEFVGIGGDAMQATGFKSYFPVEKLAVNGFVSFIKAIPRGIRLAKKLVTLLLGDDIQALILIDSPEFTHPVARWFRAQNDAPPIFDLVAPTVWAWRPWRARKMTRYIDEVLAVLPFEPQVFLELGGPKCTFIGHPAIDRAKRHQMSAVEFRKKYGLAADKPVLVLLPGSRRSEIKRHMTVFTQAVARFSKNIGGVQVVMPIVPHMHQTILQQLKNLGPDLGFELLIVENEDDKWGAFRAAELALAASGTITLELTATHTPMVVGYRLDFIATLLKHAMKIHSIVLPNLINGKNIVPEFIAGACTAEALCTALEELHQSPEVRQQQIDYLAKAAKESGGTDPQQTADRAALIILSGIEKMPR